MKTTSKRRPGAFTMIELIVVVVVLAVLYAMLFPNLFRRPRALNTRLPCMINLKEIGTAYRLWAADHGDLVPAQQSVTNGGWRELLSNANQGPICWTNYAIMQNEMGLSPRLVICPADERKPAVYFTNEFANTNVSYFVGVSANDVYPQSIAGGDRNLGDGSGPNADYGYSPQNGSGNDVAIPMTLRHDAVSWSAKMHSANGKDDQGDILLGDGSAQQASSVSLRANWLGYANPTTNWPAGHAPPVPSIRLVFP